MQLNDGGCGAQETSYSISCSDMYCTMLPIADKGLLISGLLLINYGALASL